MRLHQEAAQSLKVPNAVCVECPHFAIARRAGRSGSPPLSDYFILICIRDGLREERNTFPRWLRRAHPHIDR